MQINPCFKESLISVWIFFQATSWNSLYCPCFYFLKWLKGGGPLWNFLVIIHIFLNFSRTFNLYGDAFKSTLWGLLQLKPVMESTDAVHQWHMNLNVSTSGSSLRRPCPYLRVTSRIIGFCNGFLLLTKFNFSVRHNLFQDLSFWHYRLLLHCPWLFGSHPDTLNLTLHPVSLPFSPSLLCFENL